jgi:haloalkane dehalogenase
MDALRTPDDRFPEWLEPHYVDVGDGLRMHHVDEGSGPIVLMLHGEPSWSYLYRKVIAEVTAAGLRAIAPDLIGFGRSDKPVRRDDYSYQRHVDWTTAFVEKLDLREVTLLCQDWGGLIGLRLVAEQPHRFARVVAANTGLPTGDEKKVSDAFLTWREYAATSPSFPCGKIVERGCARPMSEATRDAYDAPFPDERYQAGARQFPALVPIRPDDPASEPNRRAWKSLAQFERPFLSLCADKDPFTRGMERRLQSSVPGAQGQPHAILENAGHYLQEDVGEELGRRVVAFVRG